MKVPEFTISNAAIFVRTFFSSPVLDFSGNAKLLLVVLSGCIKTAEITITNIEVFMRTFLYSPVFNLACNAKSLLLIGISFSPSLVRAPSASLLFPIIDS